MSKMTSLKHLVTTNGVCSLPWVHSEINLQNNTVQPCCKYTDTIGSATDEFNITWHNDYVNKLRNDLVNGITRQECFKCDSPNNTFTYKSWKNKTYLITGLLDDVDVNSPTLPKVFHFSLSNVCNLACRMCWPGSSSRINSLALKPKFTEFFTPVIVNKESISCFKGSFKNAESVTITGGEPFVNSDCMLLVNMILEESNKLKNISFSTNMTIVNVPLLEILTNLNIDITINVSIDGPKHIHEYIRQGCDWDIMLENIRYISANFPKINFGINSTISALNVGYVVEMLAAITDMQDSYKIRINNIMPSPVFNDYLHVGILPEHIKSLYRSKLSNIDQRLLSIPNSRILITTALDFLKKDHTHDTDKFLRFIKAFDSEFNTNLIITYPELKDLY